MSGRFTTLQSKGLKIDLWTIINDKIIKWHFKRRLKASMYDGFVKCHQSPDTRVSLKAISICPMFSPILLDCEVWVQKPVAPWCCGYHFCTTSFNKIWTRIPRRFKSCSKRVGDLRWRKTRTMVRLEIRRKRFLSINYTAKIIHHHHQTLR